MGKKNQVKGASQADALPAIPNKDLYQRINFAVQASTFLQSLAGPSSASSSQTARTRTIRKGKERVAEASGEPAPPTSVDIEGLAMGTMRATKKMSVHTQLKLDPSLKRSICGQCGTVLIPGLTARIRNRPDRRTMNTIHTTCLECDHTLSLPSPPTHVPPERGLDGISRKKRRERIANRSKVVFHERERPPATLDGEAQQVGHGLWLDGAKVAGWGVAPPGELIADS